jgi:hypothetical protein
MPELTPTVPQVIKTQDQEKKEALMGIFSQIEKNLGPPERQPRGFSGPLYTGELFDGRHASGFSASFVVKPQAFQMEGYSVSRPGYRGRPGMEIRMERPYRPGRTYWTGKNQINPGIGEETPETRFVTVSGNSYQEGDPRGSVKRSYVLRDDGLTQTWETWIQWVQSGGWGGNQTFSKMVENAPENNPDLWSGVSRIASIKRTTEDQLAQAIVKPEDPNTT